MRGAIEEGLDGEKGEGMVLLKSYGLRYGF